MKLTKQYAGDFDTTVLRENVNELIDISLPLESKGADVNADNNQPSIQSFVNDSIGRDNYKNYKISESISSTMKILDFSDVLISSSKNDLGENTFNGEALFLIENGGASSTDFGGEVKINVKGDGEGDYLGFTKDPTISGVIIRGDRTTANKYFINAQYCDYGLMVYGETERKAVIEVNATLCNIAYGAVPEGNSSPDEVRVLINAAYCKHWYYSSGGEESQHLTFNVENNIEPEVYNPDHFAVDYQGGKIISMAGEIRGTNGNCIGARRQSGSWGDAIHFDNLTCVQVDQGVGLYVERMTRMKGTVNFYDCTFLEGPTVHLKQCIELSSLNLVIDKCFSKYGMQLTSLENTRVNATIYMADIYNGSPNDHTALYIESATNCIVNLGDSKGNLDLSGANGCEIIIDKSFVTQGYNVVGGMTSVVKIQGSLSLPDIESITWADQVGGIVVEQFELTGTPYYYSGGEWKTTAALSGSELELRTKSSFTNTVFKKSGLSFFNTSDLKSYVSTGSSPTDNWVSLDGLNTITPSEMNGTETYVNALPDAPTNQERALYDRLLYRFEAAGLNSSNMDFLYLLAQKSEGNAFVDLFSKSANITKVGNLDFSVNSGFSNNAIDSSSYLEAPDVSARSVTDLTLGAYGLNYSSDSTRDIEDRGSKVYLRLRHGNGGYVRLGGEEKSISTSGSSPRLLQGTRLGNVQSIYSNGSKQHMVTLSDVEEWEYALRIAQSDRIVSLVYCGAAFTDNQSKLVSQAVDEYINNLGSLN